MSDHIIYTYSRSQAIADGFQIEVTKIAAEAGIDSIEHCTMLDDKTYRIWTEAFMAGSHYVGDWNQGSEILFLAEVNERFERGYNSNLFVMSSGGGPIRRPLGDFRYAVGKRERTESRGTLSLHLLGMWERDHHMPDCNPYYSLDVPTEQPWFDYALHVRGPRVMLTINGEAAMCYAVHDGAPTTENGASPNTSAG